MVDSETSRALVLVLVVGGCYSGGPADASGTTGDATSDATSDPDDDSSPDDSDADDDDTSDPDDTGDTSDTGDDPPPPAEICEPPLGRYDTSNPDAVIGDGTPESCTGAALKSAADQGGTIVFDCGPDPVTITLDAQIEPPLERDTIIDGEGKITLDGQGATRHVYFEGPDWMVTDTAIVLQRLTFVGGVAPLGEYFPQDPAAPLCAYGYKDGSGGAVYVRDARLHVIESSFVGNVAALEGPDVGGGAIYVQGSKEVLISGSEFRDNRGANGGAIGLLWANPHIYNSVFENNLAVGVGQNYVEPGCPTFNHDAQGGAGGNAGAISFDGMSDDFVVYTICGSTFTGNRANEVGGALLRTPNVAQLQMLIDRSVFDDNSARLGGATFIKQNAVSVTGSTFMNNRAGIDADGNAVEGYLGGLWVNTGSVDIVNSTFYANVPSGLDMEVGSGTVLNATFVESSANGTLDVANSLFVGTQCNATLGGGSVLQWPESTPCVGGAAFGDPGLGEIGDHGGPTPTFVPAADGPAVGKGSGCPATDQRGEARDTQICSAGAVEP